MRKDVLRLSDFWIALLNLIIICLFLFQKEPDFWTWICCFIFFVNFLIWMYKARKKSSKKRAEWMG